MRASPRRSALLRFLAEYGPRQFEATVKPTPALGRWCVRWSPERWRAPRVPPGQSRDLLANARRRRRGQRGSYPFQPVDAASSHISRRSPPVARRRRWYYLRLTPNRWAPTAINIVRQFVVQTPVAAVGRQALDHGELVDHFEVRAAKVVKQPRDVGMTRAVKLA